MNAANGNRRQFPALAAALCAVVLAGATPAAAQQFQTRLIGSWQIDWKRTAELGGKSAKEAEKAKELSITSVVYEFTESGKVSFSFTMGGNAEQIAEGSWKLTAENSKQKQLELELTVHQRAHAMTVEFLANGALKLVPHDAAATDLPALILSRVP